MRKKLLSIQEREIDLVSPEVKNDSVTFRLRAPYATTVSMYGAWMGGGHTTAATMLFPGVFDHICPMSCGMRDGENVWYNWRYYLNTFAQLLFK